MITRLKIHFAFFLLFCTCNTLLLAQDIYYPDSLWQTKKPSELKMNAALIDSAVHFAIRYHLGLCPHRPK